jgi:hypothetical protein
MATGVLQPAFKVTGILRPAFKTAGILQPAFKVTGALRPAFKTAGILQLVSWPAIDITIRRIHAWAQYAVLSMKN